MGKFWGKEGDSKLIPNLSNLPKVFKGNRGNRGDRGGRGDRGDSKFKITCLLHG